VAEGQEVLELQLEGKSDEVRARLFVYLIEALTLLTHCGICAVGSWLALVVQ
jgi:hypothetical protein